MTAVDPVREMALRWQATTPRVDDMMVEARFVKCVLRSTHPLAAYTCLVDPYDFCHPQARHVWTVWTFTVDYVVDVYGHEARAVAWDAMDERAQGWLNRLAWAWGDSDHAKVLGRAASVRYRARRRSPKWPVVTKEGA